MDAPSAIKHNATVAYGSAQLASVPESLALGEDKHGVLLPVRVRPRAHKNAVDGRREGAIVVTVTAAPVDGGANAAVIEVLSNALRCPKSALEIVRGHKSRDKVVRVPLSREELQLRLTV
ncbi:MAG: uncharacterized protein JWN98_1911 [Abditibacteriota bacterium]|nr:uncharacterized protein [Abditibacteriota bacterium]